MRCALSEKLEVQPSSLRAKRSNRSIRAESMDCFVAPLLAMTVLEISPRRGAPHRRLPGRIGGPQVEAGRNISGIDAELAAVEQRLQSAIHETRRRLAAAQLCRQFDQERRLQRAVDDQAGIAFYFRDVIAVVMDAVSVEGQRRVPKQQHRIGEMPFGM